MSLSSPVERRDTWMMPIHKSKRRSDAAPEGARAARAESLQGTGKGMVIVGFVTTIVGVVLYCAVTFAGGVDADMGDVLLHNAVPFTRATLAVLGFGTLLWLVGSFTYLRGAMDADDAAGEESPSTPGEP